MDKIGVVVCNGPSLQDVPVEWLNEHETLASNSFYAKEGFVPNHWFLEGQGHLKLAKERLARALRMHIPDRVYLNDKFVNSPEFLRFQAKITPITYWRADGSKIIGFQPEPSKTGHGTANSVTYAMFQYAFEWGFDPVLIVGMDMKFSKDGRWHFYEQSVVPEFHEMDKQRFEQWRGRAEESYHECAEYFREHGRRVYNLTPDTGTTAFYLDRLENWS